MKKCLYTLNITQVCVRWFTCDVDYIAKIQQNSLVTNHFNKNYIKFLFVTIFDALEPEFHLIESNRKKLRVLPRWQDPQAGMY